MPSLPEFDRSLLQQLGALARLHIPADRQQLVVQRLQRIVAAFDAVRELPTAGVLPTPYPMPLQMTLRPDEPAPVLTREQVLGNAPRAAAGAFVVPRVVDA